MRILVSVLLLLMLTSCGSKPEYIWKAEASNFLEKYKEMRLSGDLFQANYYLADAKKEAKKDSTLRTLALVSLSECALNFAMNEDAQCNEYEVLKMVVRDVKFDAFYQMIRNNPIEDATKLGKYEALYEAVKQKKVDSSTIKGLESITSQSIAAMYIYKNGLMTKEITMFMIDNASKENKKALMMLWMQLGTEFSNLEEKEHTLKRLDYMK